jgi:hypothetical protein
MRARAESPNFDFFSCHLFTPEFSFGPNRGREKAEGLASGLDDAHDVFFAHDEQFLAIDLDGLAGVLAEQNAVTHLDVHRDLAVLVTLARADGQDFALIGLFGGGSGMTIPEAVLRSASRRLTITRSCKGRIFMFKPAIWRWK